MFRGSAQISRVQYMIITSLWAQWPLTSSLTQCRSCQLLVVRSTNYSILLLCTDLRSMLLSKLSIKPRWPRPRWVFISMVFFIYSWYKFLFFKQMLFQLWMSVLLPKRDWIANYCKASCIILKEKEINQVLSGQTYYWTDYYSYYAFENTAHRIHWMPWIEALVNT